MSFLRNSGRQYMNQSREEQFIRYFRDTGASQALQNGMSLLFKMPTKPSNLAEFFAEYLDNGAQDLVTLSLLKAELCYKHSETQNIHRKIKQLENQIEDYESKGFGKGRETEVNEDEEVNEGDEHLVLDADRENPVRYSMLNRFLVDLDERPQSESQGPSLVPSSQDLGEEGSNVNLVGAKVKDSDESLEEDEKLEPVPIGSEEALRLKEQESLTNWNNDIKKLDPWGIVCTTKARNGGRPSGELEDALLSPETAEPDKVIHLTQQQQIQADDLQERHMMSEIISVGKGSGDSDDEKYTESEDAETLADVYHAYATAYDKFPQESPPPPKNIPIHHIYRYSHYWKNDLHIAPDKVKDVKLLSVEQPPKGDPNVKRLGDMMGWGQDFCSQSNKPEPIEGAKVNKVIPANTEPSLFPRPNWSQFTETYQTEDDTDVNANVYPPLADPCLEDLDFYRDLRWQDDAPKTFPISAKDESFLLEYDMGRIASKLESKDDPGFMFEFYQKFQPGQGQGQEGVSFCEHCQKWKMKQVARAAGREVDVAVGTSTTGLGDPNWRPGGLDIDIDPDDLDLCQCGEDCSCLCEDDPAGDKARVMRLKTRTAAAAKALAPGKMANWTKGSEVMGEGQEEEEEEIIN